MPTTLLKKLRHFYLPFLLTAIVLCGGYTFLNWLLLMKLQLFSVKEVIVNFGIPLALPWIPILLYLRPRLKLLNLKTDKGSYKDFYMIVLWFALAAPTIVAQSYLEKAAGKLTELETVNAITKQDQTKYYTLKSFYIDKSNIGVHPSFEVTGKHNDNFVMHIYVALPILGSVADTANSSCLAWMGVEYSESISNDLEEKEKQEKYDAFAQKCQADFDKKDLNQFVYLDRVGNTEDGDGYKEAVKACPKYQSNSSSVFLAINEPFEQRLGDTFFWIFASFGIGALLWFILIMLPKFDEAELERFESGTPAEEDGIKEFLSILKPKKRFFITPILIYVNVAVYLLMFLTGFGFLSFKAQDLVSWGANYRPLTANGEWWRLVTSTFLHGGLMHLVANMFGLLFVGIFLEPLLGRIRYLLAYLLTGVLASCASLLWYDATASVGASGAIFGLYGIFLSLLVSKVFSPEFAKSFLISTVVFVGFNLLMGFTGGIDNAAHIGGLVSGIILGLLFRTNLKA